MVRGTRLVLLIGLFCVAGLVTTAALGALLYVRLYVGCLYRIPQNGMYPDLPAGSRFFGIWHPYPDPSRVARGDVVVFERFIRGDRYEYVFRVVGVGGDTVEIDGDDVLINGARLPRRKVRNEETTTIWEEGSGKAAHLVALARERSARIPRTLKTTLSPQELFVMGDNRRQALDSRSFGPISFDSVIAKKW